MPETTIDRQSARRRATTGLVATALVGDVAERLAPHGILVMPIKGALLQHWLYDDPSERPMTDVDLLVRPSELERAVAALEPYGYRRTSFESVGGVVMETPWALALDLHPRLFDIGRYDMPTSDIFARSTEDSVLYGSRVRLPAQIDAYAHLIGKAVSDHLDASALGRLDEIRRMGAALHASPRTAARHLLGCGVARPARYALPLVHEVTGDSFAAEVLGRLPPDPVGGALAALGRRTFSGAEPTAIRSSIVAHLFNRSLGRGLLSGGRAAWKRLR